MLDKSPIFFIPVILPGSMSLRALRLIDNLSRFLMNFVILGVIQGKLSVGLLTLFGTRVSILLFIDALSFSQSLFVFKFLIAAVVGGDILRQFIRKTVPVVSSLTDWDLSRYVCVLQSKVQSNRWAIVVRDYRNNRYIAGGLIIDGQI